MQPLKKEAMDTLAKLPDDAHIDEIMYRLYVLRRHQPRDKRPTG